MQKRNCSKIGTYGFAACLGFLLWVGLAAFFLSYGSMGTKDGIDFIWQMVGFSFLLATLVYSVNPKSLQPKQRKRLPVIGISLILSGVLIIVGYGLMALAVKAEPSVTREALKMMGQFFFLVATFFSSGGMAMMTLGFMGED
ncbi:MAG: hypothetical protein PHP01_08020 [Phycisphaerae bacterium]|nr:hypothetical protein [Phycisphaerae bacterium]